MITLFVISQVVLLVFIVFVLIKILNLIGRLEDRIEELKDVNQDKGVKDEN